MGTETWNEVDRYFTAALGLSDEALEHALATSAAQGLPAISVSAPQGKLLHLLARACNARSILEIGTLGGYSAIWMARALPAGGRLVSLELEERHARVAAANIAHAGLSERVTIHVGNALETLARMADEGAGPFDLVFIDADKPSNPRYVEWALKLSRRGTLIVLDNVVRSGKVIFADSEDDAVRGVRQALALFADPRLTSTAIQTVGTKGYDGFAVALVIADPGEGP